MGEEEEREEAVVDVDYARSCRPEGGSSGFGANEYDFFCCGCVCDSFIMIAEKYYHWLRCWRRPGLAKAPAEYGN